MYLPRPTSPLVLVSVLTLSVATACDDGGDTGGTSEDGSEAGDGSDTGGSADTGATPDQGLWDEPGAPGTASSWAALGLAACQAEWQADAHIARVSSNDEHPFEEDLIGSVVCFSVSDPDNVCEWSGFMGGDLVITPITQFSPGWTYEATDHIGGWAVDSDTVQAQNGWGDLFTFIVTPAQHRRQTNWDLEGVPDNHPVILAGADGVLMVLDGVTGEQLEP